MGNAFGNLVDHVEEQFIAVQNVASIPESRRSLTFTELRKIKMPDNYAVNVEHVAVLYCIDGNQDGLFGYDDLHAFLRWIGELHHSGPATEFGDFVRARCLLRLWTDCLVVRPQADAAADTPADAEGQTAGSSSPLLQQSGVSGSPPSPSGAADATIDCRKVVDWLLLFLERADDDRGRRARASAPPRMRSHHQQQQQLTIDVASAAASTQATRAALPDSAAAPSPSPPSSPVPRLRLGGTTAADSENPTPTMTVPTMSPSAAHATTEARGGAGVGGDLETNDLETADQLTSSDSDDIPSSSDDAECGSPTAPRPEKRFGVAPMMMVYKLLGVQELLGVDFRAFQAELVVPSTPPAPSTPRTPPNCQTAAADLAAFVPIQQQQQQAGLSTPPAAGEYHPLPGEDSVLSAATSGRYAVSQHGQRQAADGARPRSRHHQQHRATIGETRLRIFLDAFLRAVFATFNELDLKVLVAAPNSNPGPQSV